MDSVEHLLLDNVPWSTYQAYLAEFESRPGCKLTFDRGRLEIMSPLPRHESYGSDAGRLVEFMSFERGIAIVALGSTTFRDFAETKGLEPDECYYIANAAAIRGIEGPFDPTIHPPPDLAIEVDITRRSIPRQPIYASLGVPELWRVTHPAIECLQLSEQGTYHMTERSASFPFLAPAQLWTWMQRLQFEEDLVVLREFRDWVRGLV